MFIDIIKSILPSLSSSDVKKKSILTIIDNMETTISESIIPTLISLEDVKHDNVTKNDIVERFAKSFKLKSTKSKDVFKEFNIFFTSLKVFLPKLKDDVNKYLPDLITRKTLTCRDAAYLKTVYDFNGMVTYFPDFLYFVLCAGKSDTLPKKIFADVNAQAPVFGTLYNVYNKNLEETINKLKDVSDDEYTEGNDELLEQLFTKNSSNIKLPTTSGFIGNPLYHLFMWWEDYLNKRYNANKETKRLLEIKVQELKFREQSSTGPELDKLKRQIEYYEELVADYTYKINQYKNKYQ